MLSEKQQELFNNLLELSVKKRGIDKAISHLGKKRRPDYYKEETNADVPAFAPPDGFKPKDIEELENRIDTYYEIYSSFSKKIDELVKMQADHEDFLDLKKDMQNISMKLIKDDNSTSLFNYIYHNIIKIKEYLLEFNRLRAILELKEYQVKINGKEFPEDVPDSVWSYSRILDFFGLYSVWSYSRILDFFGLYSVSDYSSELYFLNLSKAIKNLEKFTYLGSSCFYNCSTVNSDILDIKNPNVSSIADVEQALLKLNIDIIKTKNKLQHDMFTNDIKELFSASEKTLSTLFIKVSTQLEKLGLNIPTTSKGCTNRYNSMHLQYNNQQLPSPSNFELGTSNSVVKNSLT